MVGAYPEPFVHGTGGKRIPTVLECSSQSSPECTTVQKRLSSQGVIVTQGALGSGSGEHTIRVVVGPWGAVKQIRAAASLERGPAQSGVFARVGSGGAIDLLDAHARTVRTAPPGTGLLAATKP